MPLYFALTFTLSWTGVFLVIGGPAGLPAAGDELKTLFLPVYLAMLVGPVVAGPLLTGLTQGGAGLRDFLARLLKWRVNGRWYAAALLIAPLSLGGTLWALSLASPVFVPGLLAADKAAVLLLGIPVGLGAGFFEELGWTGFAIPALWRRYGSLTTGLIVGGMWGAWHLVVNFWAGGGPAGGLSLDALLPSLLFSVAVLPVYRVLMVWVYDQTGSLLVAMLMHAALTASDIICLPLAITGMPFLLWHAVLTAVRWGVAAVAAVANGGQRVRQPLGRRAA